MWVYLWRPQITLITGIIVCLPSIWLYQQIYEVEVAHQNTEIYTAHCLSKDFISTCLIYPWFLKFPQVLWTLLHRYLNFVDDIEKQEEAIIIRKKTYLRNTVSQFSNKI